MRQRLLPGRVFCTIGNTVPSSTQFAGEAAQTALSWARVSQFLQNNKKNVFLSLWVAGAEAKDSILIWIEDSEHMNGSSSTFYLMDSHESLIAYHINEQKHSNTTKDKETRKTLRYDNRHLVDGNAINYHEEKGW